MYTYDDPWFDTRIFIAGPTTIEVVYDWDYTEMNAVRFCEEPYAEWVCDFHGETCHYDCEPF